MTKTKIGSITERTKKKQNYLIGNLAQRRDLNLPKSWIRVMCRRAETFPGERCRGGRGGRKGERSWQRGCPCIRRHLKETVPWKTLNINDRNQVADERFSIKQWFAVGDHSCRLRKTSFAYCYLRIYLFPRVILLGLK